eukprot:scaffold11986_cov127-Isochrysis_galbana.AAC.9
MGSALPACSVVTVSAIRLEPSLYTWSRACQHAQESAHSASVSMEATACASWTPLCYLLIPCKCEVGDRRNLRTCSRWARLCVAAMKSRYTCSDPTL